MSSQPSGMTLRRRSAAGGAAHDASATSGSSTSAAVGGPPPGTGETATVVPSATSRASDFDYKEEEAVVAVAPAPAAVAAQPAAEVPVDDRKPPPKARPLEDRVPQRESVIKALQNNYDIDQLFIYSEHFQEKGGQAIFFDTLSEAMWDQVANQMFAAIQKYTPKKEKDHGRKAARFRQATERILDRYVHSARLFTEGESEDDSPEDQARYLEMVTFLGQIGMKFVEEYLRLVAPPFGKDRVSVKEQVETVLEEIMDVDADELFPDELVAKRVYYVVGFFCNAGLNEAGRRSKKNDVGLCIKALERHYAVGRDEDAVGRIKEELLPGLADLVDERCSYGGLKYPNWQLYSFFAIMEKVYSSITTPDNFTMYGGTLLSEICSEMLRNETLVDLFADLYEPEAFSAETIAIAMSYYVKVFGNVRAKDLCYRYNSNIQKGATVGLRQRLAAGDKKRKKEEKEAAKIALLNKKQKTEKEWMKLKQDELKEQCKKWGLRFSGTKGQLTQRLMAYEEKEAAEAAKNEATTKAPPAAALQQESDAAAAPTAAPVDSPGASPSAAPLKSNGDENADDASDDEPDEYEEPEVDDATQHSALMELANIEDIDNDTLKYCGNIEQGTDEYMEGNAKVNNS
ncbi:hypothetical protein ACHAXT_010312 [Thalassiosira profunda]